MNQTIPTVYDSVINDSVNIWDVGLGIGFGLAITDPPPVCVWALSLSLSLCMCVYVKSKVKLGYIIVRSKALELSLI